MSQFKLSEQDKIIYSLSDSDGLYSMDIDGKNRQNIIANFKKSNSDNWTVQGSNLYYLKSDDESGIWRYNLVTHEDSLVTPHIPSAIGYTFSVNPQQTHLVFGQTDNTQANIYFSKISYPTSQ